MLPKCKIRASLAMGRALHRVALGALLAALVPAGSAGAATPRAEVPGPGSTVRVDAAAGELEDGTIVVHGARGRLSVHLEAGSAPLLLESLSVLRLTTTRVAGREIADPLPPLSQEPVVRVGSKVRLVLRFRVPDATPAGIYDGRLVVASNGRRFASVPVRLRVFGVQMPARDDPAAFRTLFLIQPQTYVAAVLRGAGIEPQSAGVGITDRLYAFLSDYRISPGDWGFGTPWPDGYQDRAGWSAAAATRMAAEGAYPFSHDAAAARHAAIVALAHRPVGEAAGDVDGVPDRPGPAVLARSRLARSSARLGMGRARTRLRPPLRGAAGVCGARRGRGVSHDRRSGAAHPCPPRDDPVGPGHAQLHDSGARQRQRVPVGRPRLRRRRHLGRARRGASTAPSRRLSSSRAHIDTCSASCGPRSALARARGASIWSFTYESAAGRGSPGYAATEPATDARVFGLWNALEGMDGTLYADGMASYGTRDPYQSLAAARSARARLSRADEHRRAGARRCASRTSATASRTPISPAWSWRAARPRRAARHPRAAAHLLDPRAARCCSAAPRAASS